MLRICGSFRIPLASVTIRGDAGTIHPTHQSSLYNIGAACSCIRKMEAAVQHGMVFRPPTSDFPPDPEPLEREVLNSTYLELRNC